MDTLDYSNSVGVSNLQTITPSGATTTTLFTNVQSSIYKSDGNSGSLYNSDITHNVAGTNLAPYLLTTPPNNQNGYTFCFWLNYTGSTYNRGGNIFQLNLTNDYPNNLTNYNMIIGYSANGYFQINNSTGSSNSIPSLSSNTFYHFGITISKSNIMKLYLNGVLQFTGGVGTNLPFTYNSNMSGIQFFNGVSPYGNEKLQGYIQNFYYFDGVLSDADIVTVYNTQYN